MDTGSPISRVLEQNYSEKLTSHFLLCVTSVVARVAGVTGGSLGGCKGYGAQSLLARSRGNPTPHVVFGRRLVHV